MSIDLSQFIPTFLEESNEGLEVMESRLLDLDGADPEVINAIFRAAHSIKGGAGTFGFTAVAEFTHVVETLLDEMRNGKRQASQALINLLLQAVDCIRVLLDAARDGVEADDAQVVQVKQRLDAELKGLGADAGIATAGAETAPAQSGIAGGWQIRFTPLPELLQTGNEPLLMFQALEELGSLEVSVDSRKLPPLMALEPESLYLSWTLRLTSDCSEEAVREVFEWVEEECELQIEPLNRGGSLAAAPDPSATEAPATMPATAAPVLPAPAETPETAAALRPAAPVAAKAATAPARKASAESGSIRVGIDKVDALINRVGELVITQSMLGQIGSELAQLEHGAVEKLFAGLNQLERNTRDLQEEVMRIRMLPISFVFNRFPRMVHDIGDKLGKQVELLLAGEQTELDKTVMEKIGDPLVHLVRNSLDHGLETPQERRAAGKPETGVVKLNAYHQGGYIVIEISDDGRGLNTARIREKAIEKGLVNENQALSEQEINALIFMPGFSTAAQVSDLSGRGVGMDVVRRNIESLGGSVSVRSEPGRGATFSVSLPLTLAILDGQLIRVGSETYIVPLVSIVESLQVNRAALNAIAGQSTLYHFRDQYIPLLNVRRLFGLPGEPGALDDNLLVVVESGGTRVGLVVDELLGQQQVVIKSLESNFKRVQGISGATILGDGSVALILDVAGMLVLGLDPDSRAAPHRRKAEPAQLEGGLA